MTFSNAVPAANEKLSVSVLQIANKLLSVSRSCYVRTDMSNKAKEIAADRSFWLCGEFRQPNLHLF